MNILNLTLTPFVNETRILKESRTLTESGLFSTIFVAAVQKESDKTTRSSENGLVASRFPLASRQIPLRSAALIAMYLEYGVKAWKAHRNDHITCVTAHSLGTLPIALVLAKIWTAKCVYDAHELETEVEGLHGKMQRVARWLEKRLISKPDLIIVVSESIADWYQQTYAIKRPVVVLNSPVLKPSVTSNILREKLAIDDAKRIVIYQGFLTTGRGVELTLQAFKDPAIAPKLALVFMGYGPLDHMIREAQKTNDSIYLLPAVPPDDVMIHTASADIGLALIANTCLSYYLCMPNKLFEYSMVGLPVIASDMKEMANFVQKHGLGRVLEDYTSSSLVKELNLLASTDAKTMQKNSSAIISQFSWEAQEVKLLDAYQAIFKKSVD